MSENQDAGPIYWGGDRDPVIADNMFFGNKLVTQVDRSTAPISSPSGESVLAPGGTCLTCGAEIVPVGDDVNLNAVEEHGQTWERGRLVMACRKALE